MTDQTVPFEHLGALLRESVHPGRPNGYRYRSVPGTLLLENLQHTPGVETLRDHSTGPAPHALLLVAPGDWPPAPFLSGSEQPPEPVPADTAHAAAPNRTALNEEQLTPVASVPTGYLPLKSARKVLLLKVDDIDWIRARHNHVVLQIGNQSHLMRASLGSFQRKLPSDKFVRINRSNIVRIDRIKELDRLVSGGCAIRLHDGTQLTLSRRYRPGFHKLGLL